MNPLFHDNFSISDSLKFVRKSVLIYETIIPYATPARQTDYTGLPPAYTFVGVGEPFYTETCAYIDNLRKAGVEAEIDIYETDMHAFDMLSPDEKLSKMAAQRFNERFEYAIGHYFAQNYG